MEVRKSILLSGVAWANGSNGAKEFDRSSTDMLLPQGEKHSLPDG